MDAIINWLGRMSFSGTSDSGFTVDMGTDASVGGDNDGFRPLELMAISLGGCTSMDVMSILSKKRMIITGFEVKVHAERTIEHPMVFTSATIEYLISGHSVSEESVLRAIELSAVKYCPAQSMLAKAFPINLKYQIFEDVEEGNRELVSFGTYELAKG